MFLGSSSSLPLLLYCVLPAMSPPPVDAHTGFVKRYNGQTWMGCLNVLKTITGPGITCRDASDLCRRNVVAHPCPSIILAHLTVGLTPGSRWMKHQNLSNHARLIPGANICLKLGRVLLTRADFSPNQLMPTFSKTESKLATMHGPEPAHF